MMKEQGQAYLIALIIITIFVFGLFFLSFRQPVQPSDQPNKPFFENVQTEMIQSYATALYAQDVPAVMGGTAALFKNRARTMQHQLELCFMAFDQNNTYYFGNYSGQDGNAISQYSNTLVPKNTVKPIAKQTLLNDFNLSFCGNAFDLTQNLNLSITLKRGKGVIQWKNEE